MTKKKSTKWDREVQGWDVLWEGFEVEWLIGQKKIVRGLRAAKNYYSETKLK